MLSLKKHVLPVFLTTLTLLGSLRSWALDPSVEALIRYETGSNAVSERSNKAIAIENYEIPFSILETDIADRMPKDVRDALIFERNGEKYVRWMINPEDTKWHKEVEKFLKSRNLSAERHRYFTGYMTASRSYILEDPVTHAQFSAKVSTDKTGGNWRDKQQPVDDARQVRLASDMVQKHLAANPPPNLVAMDEPAMFGINEIDQAMLVRTLGELRSGGRFYIPGFSVLHEKTGAEIARLNGSSDPARFWNEHYNQPLARAMAEFAARTGLTYDSPHSQNFLVELDEKLKPTGRIVMRDFGDTYALRSFFKSAGEEAFLGKWEKGNITDVLDVGVGVLHGNESPKWIPDSIYEQWGKDFYQAFEDEYSRQTGIPVTELRAKLVRSGMYFGKDYQPSGRGWKAYFSRIASEFKAGAKSIQSAGSSLCGEAFAPAH